MPLKHHEEQLDPYHLANSRLGVIGGSGLYAMEGIKNVKEIDVSTPFGKPSDSFWLGELGGMEIVFLARHGRNHTLSPSDIPYQANIWALRSLNVRWIISPSAVGSLQANIKPLDVVIPDQFIDRTHQRPLTFFSDGVVAHVSMADPFCSILSDIVINSVKEIMPRERTLHIGGVYLAIEGPAFSTRAESNLYRNWNCSIIGMTNHTEARLSKEAEIAYTSVSMVTDYDCWKENEDPVSVEMVINNLKENAKTGTEIIKAAALSLSKLRPKSKAHVALRNGLVTSKKMVPMKTREKINLFTKNYWGDLKVN